MYISYEGIKEKEVQPRRFKMSYNPNNINIDDKVYHNGNFIGTVKEIKGTDALVWESAGQMNDEEVGEYRHFHITKIYNRG